jgi:hypothetical protein
LERVQLSLGSSIGLWLICRACQPDNTPYICEHQRTSIRIPSEPGSRCTLKKAKDSSRKERSEKAFAAGIRKGQELAGLFTNAIITAQKARIAELEANLQSEALSYFSSRQELEATQRELNTAHKRIADLALDKQELTRQLRAAAGKIPKKLPAAIERI